MSLLGRNTLWGLLPFAVACATEAPIPRALTQATTAAGSAAVATVSVKPSEGPAMKAPQFELAETPADKLGSAPTGFGPRVGEKAPTATLPDINGVLQNLANVYVQGPTLVVFYRGGWCPFCNLQLHQLSEAKPEFDKRGVRIVAISVDKPSEEAKTQAKHGVPFLMLSDSTLALHEKYRVVHLPGDEERAKLAGYEIDLFAYSGQPHGKFAVPASVLVDRTGTVRFAHVDEDYKTRPSARQLLEIVDKTFK